jgi:serine protease
MARILKCDENIGRALAVERILLIRKLKSGLSFCQHSFRGGCMRLFSKLSDLMPMTLQAKIRYPLLLSVVLLSSSSFAARYAVIFKDSQSYNQVHSQWVLNSSSHVEKMFSNRRAPVQVQKSLTQLQTVVVSTDDESLLEALSQGQDVIVEKEVIHPAPKLVSNYEMTPAWGFDSGYMLENHLPRNANRAEAPKPPAGPGNFSDEKMPWGVVAVKAPEAWAKGQLGRGARVLVLDTGVDKNHPALQGQIEDMKDFVGDHNTPYPVADKIGHGTHVAGTILARKSSSGFSGVAPEAKLLMGRVCSENGCSSMDVIEGVNWAIEKKVDVLNLSLGSDQQTSVEKAAMARAENAGVIVVAASGNDGKASVGYPAAYPTVLAVGAVDQDLKKADFSQWGPELDIMGPGVDVMSSVPMGTGCHAEAQLGLPASAEQVVKATCFSGSAYLKGLKKEMMDAGLGKPSDFAGQDFKGHFALISRGEIAFTEKVRNALTANAAGIVFANNKPGLISGGATEDGSSLKIPVVMIEQTVGENIRAQLKAQKTVSLNVETVAVDYASFAGTSMACPHVAGVMALVRGAKKSLTPSQARTLLKETATSVGVASETGSGLVNAEKAVAKASQMR